MDSLIKLKVSIHSVATTLVPLTFVRLEHAWVNENTCAQLLERLLRENGLKKIAEQLDTSDIMLKFFRTIGVQNAFASKRTMVSDEKGAPTFFMDGVL